MTEAATATDAQKLGEIHTLVQNVESGADEILDKAERIIERITGEGRPSHEDVPRAAGIRPELQSAINVIDMVRGRLNELSKLI